MHTIRKYRVRHLGLWVLVGRFLAGCAPIPSSQGAPEQPSTAPESTVIVTHPKVRRVLPVALRSVRLSAAVKRFEHALGHDIQVQVDAGLVPPDRERFTTALATTIEGATTALE